QVLSGGALGRDDAEEDRDVRVVDGLEIDAVRDDEQGRDLLRQLRERAVRDRDAFADARALELLALEERALDIGDGDPVTPADERGEESDRLVLVEGLAVGALDADALRRE